MPLSATPRLMRNQGRRVRIVIRHRNRPRLPLPTLGRYAEPTPGDQPVAANSPSPPYTRRPPPGSGLASGLPGSPKATREAGSAWRPRRRSARLRLAGGIAEGVPSGTLRTAGGIALVAADLAERRPSAERCPRELRKCARRTEVEKLRDHRRPRVDRALLKTNPRGPWAGSRPAGLTAPARSAGAAPTPSR
jgi:hypothetical protein